MTDKGSTGTDLPPRIQRMVKEEDELLTKIERLSFFMSTDDYSFIERDEQERLRAQLFFMRGYRKVLVERLRFAGVDV